MSKSDKVIAIFTADWHLSHTPPVWRSNEPDWYAAMKRPLDEIRQLQRKHKCPIFVAGDIFDRWYGASGKGECSELINWAIENVPECYAIAGQHDLPEHNLNEMYRCAYHSLALSKTICDLGCGLKIKKPNLMIYSFPYGTKLKPTIKGGNNIIKVAIIHEYACIQGHDYPKAPKESYVHSRLKNTKFGGYDVVVYGDNHKGFSTISGKTKVFNCGTLMRRKSDEETYQPRIGLLHEDGRVESHFLEISKDIHLTAEEAVKIEAEREEELDVEMLYQELKKLGDSALEYASAVKQHCHRRHTKKSVVNILTKAMEA